MPDNQNRRLAAILFADIVNYTSLMQADETLALQKIKRYQTLLDSAAQQFNGQVLKNYGDGSLMTFSNSVDAVKAAKQIQEQAKSEPTVPLRIGIHVGEFIVEKSAGSFGGDIYGNGVNLASRIESLGIAGAVLFSKNIFQKIKNQPEFEVQSLGSFEFKNVEEPMEVFALANEGFPILKREEMQGKLKTIPKESNDSFFQRLWRKKVPQILAAYLFIGWTLVQLTDWGLHQFGVSPHWSRILFIIILGIIPSLLVYLNSREQIHNNSFTRKQKILFPTNFIILGVVLFFMFRTADLGATSKNITFVNADGIEETRNVIKEEFRKHIPIFPFEQIQEDSTTEFWGRGLPDCLGLDLGQNKYVNTHARNTANLSTGDKIKMAKAYDGDFYVDGRYQVTDGNFEITPILRNSKNGNIVNERTFQGRDFFSLVDSLSLYLKSAIGLSPQQMEESIDLDFKEFTTSNVEAGKEMILFFNNFEKSHLEKALELDTTFGGASLTLAVMYHTGYVSKFESKSYIDHAMRHRNKLPFFAQIRTMVYHHLIYEEYEKAEKLLKMQLEISPNDNELNHTLSEVYWQTGQVDQIIEQSEKLFAQNPTPLTGFLAVQAALMKGEPQKAIRMIKGFLLLDAQNTTVLSLLAEAYLHKGDYKAAKETIEKIILIDPEKETCIAPLLDAVNYLESNPNDPDLLAKYEGTYRNSGQPQRSYNQVLNNQLFIRFANLGGKFTYPTGENTFIRVSPTFSQRSKFLTNDEGAVYTILNTNIRNSGESQFYIWKQDSTIWKAEELLNKKDYQKALTAYELAIEKHPEHIYLSQYKAHLEFMLSKSKEDILSLYQRYVGEYGKVSVRMENDQLLWKSPGLRESVLLPISDHQFLLSEFYVYLYEFEEKNGEVDAIQEYKFEVESASWEKVEDWYFKKDRLLD